MGLIDDLKNIKSLPATYLIMGRSTTGKTTQALELVKDKSKVLWIAYSNLDILFEKPLDVEMRLVDNPTHAELVEAAAQVKAFAPDAIVLDGLDVLGRRVIDGLAKDKTNPTQADWAVMGRIMDNLVALYKSLSPVLVATVNVVEVSDTSGKPTGTYDVAMNRDLYNRIMPHFFHKYYTATLANPKTGEVVYLVQTNAALAVKLIAPNPPNSLTTEKKG